MSKKGARNAAPDNNEHRKIDLLVLGGSRFKDRDPNDFDHTNECLMLSIYPNRATYELKHLPGAKLRCPDKFCGNM